ncbi:MAG TPA: hypothetical protein VE077_02405 [Candidatus Methylomirabilis sp.]|nr:hypothetical protein [Candidatus Methylomirabilis sp.]
MMLLAASAAAADSLEESARALARKVAANLRGAYASCQVRNLSMLGSTELAAFSSAFQDELQKRGVRIATGEAPVSLVVTVTQNPTEYISVVQIRGKESAETVMGTLGSVSNRAPQDMAFSYTLRKELLFSQDRPILDVVFDDGGKKAAVLGLQEINSYEQSGNQWSMTGSQKLPVQRYAERDARGLLALAADGSATAFAPGEICRLAAAETHGWNCESSSAAVPVRTLSQDVWAGAKDNAWMSAAKLEPPGQTQIVLAERDGVARLYEGGAQPVAVFPDWGSQLTAINSGCGAGWQLLVTGKGDWTQSDEVRAVEIRGRTATPVSFPVEFAGPVVTLHNPGVTASAVPRANSNAIAIERNLQTGRYEAYRLTLSCAD